MIKTILKAWEHQKEKNWPHTYWLVDIHDTILYPKYGGISDVYYPFAKEALQLASAMPDIKLIIWSCSKPEDLRKYEEFFANDQINFDYTNANPDALVYPFGDFTIKPYCNCMFDDKAGFTPNEWENIYTLLQRRMRTV